MLDSKGEWQPIWARGGKIDEVAWIGKEVVAWCSGLYIVFFHVSQKRESLRWLSKAENPDGVCCLSGHPTMHLLAFSDKTFINPKIRILSYPSMNKISQCVSGSKIGYLATAFNSADNLISLSSNPNYSLTIWASKTGERLGSIDTSIRDMEGQIIRVTFGKPTLVAQLGRPSGKLHIWEIGAAGKTIIFTKNEAVLPKESLAYHMDWSSDSGELLLAVVDQFGHIYISNKDGSSVYRIVLTQRCGVCLEYEAPSVCWFRDGIILRTTFCQIRFFKKDIKSVWRKQWYVKSTLKPCMLNVHPLKNDRLLYHTQEGFLMELSIVEGQDTPVIDRRMHYGGFYSFADMIRPWGHHIIAIDSPSEVAVLECYDGRQVGRLDLALDGEVIQLLSHPDIPLVAVTSKEGELAILSLMAAENPLLIAKFDLQSERLDLIKFSQSGKNLVVGQRTTGVCYCISLTRDKPFLVTTTVETKCRMSDVLFYDNGGHLKLLVLVVSSKKIPVAHHLAVYDLQAATKGEIEPTSYLELPYPYQYLHYAPEGLYRLIGTVYLSRQIHALEVKNWKQVNLFDAMPSGHQVRRARLCTDRQWITSAALDGLVTLRSGKTTKVVGTLMTHHRRDLGVVKSVVQPSGNVVVALGYSGSLVGMKFCQESEAINPEHAASYCRVDFGEYERIKKKVLDDYARLDSDIVEILSKSVGVFPPLEDGVKITWVKWRKEAILLKEAEEYSQERIAIKADFVKLQEKVVKLLNDNEACPEIERLPISMFDLDKGSRDQRLKAARDEREDIQLQLEHTCISMEKVMNWIKSTFWDSQKTIGQSIFPIFGDEEITNYDMTSDTPEVDDMLRLAKLYWDSEKNQMDEEPFCPLKLYPTSKLQLALPKESKFDKADERQRMNALLGSDDEEEHEIDPSEVEDQLAKEGMTTHRFIEPSNHYCSQFEGAAFTQLLLENRNIADDCKRLREYFNKLFVDMYAVKEREMSLVRERNERIRFIDSELRLMFGKSMSQMPIDPDWNYKEIPTSIVEVLDEEVKVKPYISASQQELLDKQAVEAERLRQILLADDFREKTLIKMMDGVLEIRWEDIIKKDIAKPQCMLIKDPEEYNTDDLLAIRQYEKDVENLDQERLRYRRILETELGKVNGAVNDGVCKFDAKLRDFLQVKIAVESAIQQLNLRILRGWIRHMHRMKAMREEHDTRQKIAEKRKILTKLAEEVRVLQSLAQEYRNQYEALTTKERTMEKKFRSDFPSLRKVLVEVLEKEYKRRPRMIIKNCTPSDFIELGRNVASHKKGSHLPHECYEYLRHIEVLDVKPVGLPQAIESLHWDHLIRARRNKIELEMKMRAQMAELHETERTTTAHNEKINTCNTDIDSLKEQLNTMKQERMDFDLDMEIQLVLKMGQIEVCPKGRRDDMINAIFIPRDEIDAVNDMIKRAGERKLAAMNHTINFRRGILFKEWEHKFRKRTIVDLEEDLSMIQNVVVTRDIRDYLKRQSMGLKDVNTPQQLQKELGAMKKNCEKNLRELLLRLEEIESKILKIRKENKQMDRKIEEMNVYRCELEWQRDLDGEAKQKEYNDRRMAVVVRRSKLVRALQKEYIEVLALQTEHELLRQRRFPALSFFRTLDDEPK